MTESPASPASRPAPAVRLGWVLAGALLLRLLLLTDTVTLGPRISDERDYVQLATSLVEGRGFSFASGPTSLRPPLFPGFVAGLWLASGSESLQLVRLAQAFLGLLTAWLVFELASAVYDRNAGLVAGTLAALYPSLVFANFLILSETLFTLLLVAAMLALVRLIRTPSLTRALCTGLLIGLAALTRSVLWPFPLVIAPLVAWWTPGRVTDRLSIAAALLAGTAIAIGPWAIRNSRLQGVPVVVDTMGGLNLRMGNYEYTPHGRIWDAVSMRGDKSWIVGIPQEPPGGGTWTEGTKERWARGEAVRYITAHPVQTLWRSSIKFGDFWALDRDFLAGVMQGLFHPPAWFTVIAGAALLAAYPAVLAAALAGIWLAPPGDRRVHWALLLVVAFVCALHSLVFAHPRYRLPLMPVLMVYAAAALTRLNRESLTNLRRAWPVFACLALAAGIWTAQFFVRDAAFIWRLMGLSAS